LTVTSILACLPCAIICLPCTVCIGIPVGLVEGLLTFGLLIPLLCCAGLVGLFTSGDDTPDAPDADPAASTFNSTNGDSSTGCDFNDVEQLLSNFVNSSTFATSEPVSPQEKAMLWLKNQNNTEVEQCSPYSTLQRYVLAALYYSTNGADWAQQGNYLSNKNVCSWKGVFCDDNIIATKLILETNNLHGTIPDEIGELKLLEKLKFTSNSLVGTLPSTLGNLMSLEELNLGDNALTGSIPKELGNVSPLSVISLYENNLSGSVPSELSNLQGLKGLFLFDNDITGNVAALCASGNITIKVDCAEIDGCNCCLC